MNSLPCDIVILPSDEIATQAINLSQQLAVHKTLYTLKSGVCYPHASIYMCQLKLDDLDKIKEVLSSIADTTAPLKLEAGNYGQSMGFIDANYKLTPEVISLQNKVVAAINPLRDGMREKDKARLVDATGVARENLERYGYQYVGELFWPHISLTRFEIDEPIATDNLPPVSDFSGNFSKLGLFEMGDNGTCIRQLAIFDLQA